MNVTRCLFLACSGVRVKSEEFRALGVTLPGFIERGNVIASLPSLGLLTIASFSPEDWELEYRETADITPKEIVARGYDLVAISSLTAQIDMAYSIADELRSAGLTVILGGLHVSALPEEAMEHASAVVVGEGEYTWGQLCRDFESNSLRRRYNAADFGLFNFDDARVPRYDLLDMKKYNRITVQTQRGCPRKCHFCAASHTISNYKCKTPLQVLREIEEIKKFWAHPFIEFADDNTFLDRRNAKNLLRTLIPQRIRWFTESDISVSEDTELLELISVAGCYQVLIGLESVDSDALAEVDRRGWKLKQHVKYRSAIEKIQSYGISVNGCFVLGWDHDTLDVFKDTLDFVVDLGLSEVQLTVLTPFPNTVLFQKLKAEGRLIDEIFWDACTLFDVTFRPSRMSVEQLQQGLLWLFRQIYSEDATSRRKSVFKACVTQKRGVRRRFRNRVFA